MHNIVRHAKRFWHILGPFRPQAILFVAISLFTAVLDGIGLTMLIPIIDRIVNADTENTFSIWIAENFGQIETNTLLLGSALILTFTMVLKEIFLIWREYFTSKFGMDLRNRWRRQLSESLLFSEEGSIAESRSGALVDLIINQTLSAGKFVQFSLSLIVDVIFVLVLLALMVTVSWWVTLVVMIVFGLTVGATYIPAKRYANKLGRKALSTALRVSASLNESLAGLRELKIFSLESKAVDEISRLSCEQAKLNVQERVFSRLPSTVGNLLLALMVLAGVVVVAALPAVATQALLPAAVLFIVVGQRLSVQITSAISRWMSVRTLFPAMNLVTATLDEIISKIVPSGEARFVGPAEEIRFVDIRYGYPKGGAVLADVSVAFTSGTVTTIIGSSGSGKSTIADLLFGLRRAEHGRILVNGHDLYNYNIMSWRERCSYVSQRPFLFNGTIADNIRLGRADATEDQIVEAAVRAHADEFIEDLPHRYDTKVGERGSRLSGGQAQRITIARALLRQPDLVVFDEPTSALDGTSKGYLIETFRALAGAGGIVVVMTHDADLIKDADTIYEINGKNLEIRC